MPLQELIVNSLSYFETINYLLFDSLAKPKVGGGVIGNTPGSGPGNWGSSPCPPDSPFENTYGL